MATVSTLPELKAALVTRCSIRPNQFPPPIIVSQGCLWSGEEQRAVFIYFCVCVYNVDVCDHAHATVCMWRLEDNSGISDAVLAPYESWRLSSGLVASTFTQRARALARTCVLT